MHNCPELGLPQDSKEKEEKRLYELLKIQTFRRKSGW